MVKSISNSLSFYKKKRAQCHSIDEIEIIEIFLELMIFCYKWLNSFRME